MKQTNSYKINAEIEIQAINLEIGQPDVLECTFHDALGIQRKIKEKVPVLTAEEINEHTKFPKLIKLSGTVELFDYQNQAVVTFKTNHSVEDVDGKKSFKIDKKGLLFVPQVFMVSSTWLNFFLIVGFSLMILSCVNVFFNGMNWIQILPITMAIIALYQYWNYRMNGYVRIIGNVMEVLSNGIRKKSIQLTDISAIQKRAKSYVIRFKNGGSSQLGINFISVNQRTDFENAFKKISAINSCK